MDTPTKNAKSGYIHIAYRIFGDGPPDNGLHATFDDPARAASPENGDSIPSGISA